MMNMAMWLWPQITNFLRQESIFIRDVVFILLVYGCLWMFMVFICFHATWDINLSRWGASQTVGRLDPVCCFQLRASRCQLGPLGCFWFWLIWLTSSCSLNFFDVRSFCSSFIPCLRYWDNVCVMILDSSWFVSKGILAGCQSSGWVPGWIPMFARWLTFFCRSNILQLPILQWLGPSTASGSSWWDRPFLPGAIKEGDDSAYSRRDGDVSPCLNNTWIFGELESGMESAQIGVCIGIMYGDAWCKEPTKN